MKIHKNLLITGIIAASIVHLQSEAAAVTYTYSGRLGDQLLAYMHAKWVSYVYKIPVWYKPFTYSDQLVLSRLETLYQEGNLKQFQYIKEFKKTDTLSIQPATSTLYVIPYFPESLEEHQEAQPGINASNNHARPAGNYFYFSVDWQDPVFLAQIRSAIKPIKELRLVQPVQDLINVAVHVRKNSGGFDLPFLHGLPEEKYDPHQKYVDVIFPFKHPPDEYYIEQIKKIYSMCNQRPLYVFIFTDDPDPIKIMNKYREEINNENISFACRTSENNHYSNVLEDLFSMMGFDCLVRADSNLSIVASILADYALLITPAHHRWEGRKLYIDAVNIKINQQKMDVLLHEQKTYL